MCSRDTERALPRGAWRVRGKVGVKSVVTRGLGRQWPGTLLPQITCPSHEQKPEGTRSPRGPTVHSGSRGTAGRGRARSTEASSLASWRPVGRQSGAWKKPAVRRALHVKLTARCEKDSNKT